jgi:hypothetical protein
MKNSVPLEFEDVLSMDQVCEVADDAPDVYDQFLETAKLAGAIGGRDGFRHAANFAEEVAQLDREHREHYQKLAKDAARAEAIEKQKLEKSTPTPEVTQRDDDSLGKRIATDAHARRVFNLREWMRSQLALGKTTSELIAHAEMHDAATANLLREAAGEL